MNKIHIVKDNNALLRKKSVDVSLPLSNEDKDTLLAMLTYLKLSKDEEYRKRNPKVREGVGLAAPQIGLLKKMIVVHLFLQDQEITHVLVNPKITSNSVKKCYLKNGEGCLSVDKEHEGYVIRDFKIEVEAFDALKNENVTIKATGFEAIVLQHEIDHLNGILFYDRINKFNPFFIPDNSVEL